MLQELPWGFEFFADGIDVDEIGREASRIAKTMVLGRLLSIGSYASSYS